MAWQIAVLLLLLRLSSAFPAAPMVRRGCRAECGGVKIPYPFGIGRGCFLPGFDIACDTTTNGSKVPLIGHGNLEVLNISLVDGLMQVKHFIAHDCYDGQGKRLRRSSPSMELGRTRSIRFSDTSNKFVAIGCDTRGYLTDMNRTFWTGCVSYCNNTSFVTNGTCSGIGCCETRIPKGLRSFTVELTSFHSHTYCSSFSPCSYAFLADSSFSFNASDFLTFRNVKMMPVTLEWAVGNKSCEEAQGKKGYACVDVNSKCYDSSTVQGYHCNCSQGYEGNPYLPGGCQDIDECARREQYRCYGACRNSPGSYTCYCPEGTHGNAMIKAGCIRDKSVLGTIFITAGSVGVGILLLLGSSVLIWKKLKEISVKRGKKKLFRENRGLLLQQLVSSDETLVERMKIFTLEELEKATNNFDGTRVVGKGGHGTVYKGILSDQRVVAIKRSKIANQIELDQFINEMVILSQINHRNVVKLFGCCLESKVPLLVYEFISGGTLFNHLHDSQHFAPLSLQDRLKIAAEIASALSYLHYAASISIFHRDVKSSNILLDESYAAKVSDFGASRSIPLNRTCVTTAVQGTYGYLDPEYHHTGQLTEKSDVYSFGVILLELLTGKNPISYSRHTERTLTLDFIYSLRENHLCDILDPYIVEDGGEEEIEIVASLTELCLRLKGEERPTMREVEQKLDTMRRFGKSKHDVDAVQNGGMTAGLPGKIPVEGNASDSTKQYSMVEELMLSLIEQHR